MDKQELATIQAASAKKAMDNGSFHYSQYLEAAEVAIISINKHLQAENAVLHAQNAQKNLVAVLQFALKIATS